MSPCITEKACIALLFIESEDYILNGFRFLGCISRSNHPLHSTIHCNDCINAGVKTTQSPQRPTEVSLLFENVLITFVIFSRWIFASDFLFWMVWMQPVHFSFLDGLDATSPFFLFSVVQSIFSFLDGLDATSPFFVSRWSACNQSIFCFSMVWMQPVHFSFSRWSGCNQSIFRFRFLRGIVGFSNPFQFLRGIVGFPNPFRFLQWKF